jgi:S-DNA-T family DNA segregation ATPase FtsK/SpoIIIE
VIESPAVRIPAPVVAGDPPRTAFPFVATVAPVVAAAVLFAVTSSPFMLLMAALGPVIAVATFADGRRQLRRSRRESTARFHAELSAAGDLARAAYAAELGRRRTFATLEPAWGRAEAAAFAVTRGDVPSGIELPGVDRVDDDPALVELRREVAFLPGAPVLRPVTGAFAVEGPAVAAAAVARTLALRIAARLSPVDAALEAPADEDWTARLPHDVEHGPSGAYRWRLVDRDLPITWSAGPEPGAHPVDALRSDATTRPAARRAAAALAAAARAAGLTAPGGRLPASVALSALLADPPRSGLAAPLGVDATGAFVLDLVTDGPHAVVAGMTGSGKSELLVSWVLGMATGRSPAEVSFVLVDFKGGAAFAPLAGLPHVLGTLSDLDERLARRAIESLRAEVLRRERVLAAAGVRAIDELPSSILARLVVVVDEFAALLAERSDLHALFADLAARGRSLGVHLVLCTQRPAGVVRDAVLANIAVRVALRVADRGDSLGLLGDDAAARLPATPKGRAVVVDGSGLRRTVQIALADAADVARLVAVTPAGDVPRPWCDPLPPVVPHAGLPTTADGIAFGLLDLPAEQRQPVAVLRPRDGHLLVLGAPGAGRTTALASLAAGAGESARWLPRDPVGLWAVLSELEAIPDGTILLADDLDLTLARCGPDHAVELAELVARLLRDAPSRDVRVVASARRLAAPVHALAPLFGSRLLLRLGGRDEHVLAGGDGTLFDPHATPGAGWWEGAAVQVALPEAAPRRELPVPPPLVVGLPERGELAIVAARPRELLDRWGHRRVHVRVLGAPDDGLVVDPGCTIVLGDPDAWQAAWAELARVRRDLPLVVHGCSPADLRTLTRSREVPPLLADGEVWLVEQGRVHRAVLDDGRGV